MIDPRRYTIRPEMDEDKQVRELPLAVRSLTEARTGDAVYVVDPDYRIVHWDSRMESITGALAQEALGQPCYEAVMGEREDGGPFCAQGCSLMHLARAHRPVSAFEMRIKTRSGDRTMGERQQPHGRDQRGAIPGAPISRHPGNPRRA